jgi:glyoxylase-like metal-dependent hydrolase (beta-lactamase superfamily II)
MSLISAVPADPGRAPQPVQPGLWLFAPSRDSQGGSAWWLEWPQPVGGLLIDCPGYTEANLAFLRERGAGRIVLTSREGHGRVRRFQEALGWPVLVQEQEAYLLPGLQRLDTFGQEHGMAAGLRLLWTPGPTPGSCVLLAGEGLFCGRLLSPTAPGQAAPLRSSRSFHWGRWLRSLAALRQWLPEGSPHWIATGAGLGALRGEKLIAPGRPLLEGLDLEALALQRPR